MTLGSSWLPAAKESATSIALWAASKMFVLTVRCSSDEGMHGTVQYGHVLYQGC